MTQYMLMFSLGPVQSFIAQARKTRDLWLGSYLLSTLMVEAMSELEKFATEKKIEDILIFPTKREIENFIPDLPNKYVAIFDDADKARKTAEQSKQNIIQQWKAICNQVWASVIQPVATQETESIWRRQTNGETFFEIFWVVVERREGPELYRDWLKRTQQALDARKHLRDFTVPIDPDDPEAPTNEGHEKSTVSGEREALRDKATSREQVKQFWRKVATRQSPYNINQEGNERLDAVDTVKRFATESTYIPKQPFPSTSSVATASFVEKLLDNDRIFPELMEWLNVTGTKVEGKTPLADMPMGAIPYLEKLVKKDGAKRPILKRDGDCYFPETFTEYRLHEDYGLSPEIARTIAKQGSKDLSNLLRAIREREMQIARPRSYYAMIQMDGDKMGVLLSGVNDQLEHQNISKALSDFARENVPKTVQDDYPGRLIYAGGDDVFALAPLARDYDRQTKPDGFLTVLDLVNELQQQYQKIVKDAVSDKGRQDNVTASTGIAIAHHFTSLSYVRRMAKNAEDIAKHFYGRNALVVTLLRRSGEQTQVGCKWEYTIQENGENKSINPLSLFSDFFDLFKKDVLSSKLVFELLEEAPAIVGTSEKPEELLSIYARQEGEIKRVLRRHRDEKKKEELPDKTIDELAHRIANLSRAMDDEKKPDLKKDEKPSTELHSDRRRYGLVEALGWLLVMDFLAREEHE